MSTNRHPDETGPYEEEFYSAERSNLHIHAPAELPLPSHPSHAHPTPYQQNPEEKPFFPAAEPGAPFARGKVPTLRSPEVPLGSSDLGPRDDLLDPASYPSHPTDPYNDFTPSYHPDPYAYGRGDEQTSGSVGRRGSENVAQSYGEGASVFHAQLQNTIGEYRSMLQTCETEQDRSRVQGLIRTLEGQLRTLSDAPVHSKRSAASNAGRAETVEERRAKGLRELFDFYTRKQLLVGRHATFDQIQKEMSFLNLGEFMAIIKDFKIRVSKPKSTEIFKKFAKYSRELYFESFEDALCRLFVEAGRQELEDLSKRLQEVDKIIARKEETFRKKVAQDLRESALARRRQQEQESQKEAVETQSRASPGRKSLALGGTKALAVSAAPVNPQASLNNTLERDTSA